MVEVFMKKCEQKTINRLSALSLLLSLVHIFSLYSQPKRATCPATQKQQSSQQNQPPKKQTPAIPKPNHTTSPTAQPQKTQRVKQALYRIRHSGTIQWPESYLSLLSNLALGKPIPSDVSINKKQASACQNPFLDMHPIYKKKVVLDPSMKETFVLPASLSQHITPMPKLSLHQIIVNQQQPTTCATQTCFNAVVIQHLFQVDAPINAQTIRACITELDRSHCIPTEYLSDDQQKKLFSELGIKDYKRYLHIPNKALFIIKMKHLYPHARCTDIPILTKQQEDLEKKKLEEKVPHLEEIVATHKGIQHYVLDIGNTFISHRVLLTLIKRPENNTYQLLFMDSNNVPLSLDMQDQWDDYKIYAGYIQEFLQLMISSIQKQLVTPTKNQAKTSKI
jgi:hypothetical protein